MRSDANWHYFGDVDMLGYGGTFYRNVGGRRWHFVKIDNMDEACGRDNEGYPPYHVELSEVDLDAISPSQLRSALDCCGVAPDEITDERCAEACHQYGAHAPLWSESGNNGHALIRAAKRESRALCSDADAYEARMSTPVNKIGSTAREYMLGDLTSPILRGLAEGSPEAEIMAKMGMLRRNDGDK